MSAKEMFEELGYECDDYSKYKLMPHNIQDKLFAICVYQKSGREIAFFHNTKTIELVLPDEEITLQELQAINKQVEELGWNKHEI